MNFPRAKGLRAIVALGVGVASVARAPAQATASPVEVTTLMRFAESPRRVPASLSVLTQRDLDRRGIESMDQLQFQVPSLVAGAALPTFTLRGVGARIVGPASEPGFAIRQGGVTSSRVDIASMGFFDLERVELGRGPQGTLYGRNTAGGVMNIVPRRPADSFAAALDFEVGNFDSARLRAVLNAPLPGDRAAVRLAVQHRQRDGFDEQLHAGAHALDRDDTSLRASFYAQLAETLRLDFAWTFWREDDSGMTMLRSAPGLAGNEQLRQNLDRSVHFGTLALAWKVADFTLTATGGYQSHDFSNRFNADHSELDIRTASVFDDVRAWSSDLEILFADGGPFRFAFGVGYFDEENEGAGGDDLRFRQTTATRMPDGVPTELDDRTRLFATATNRSVDTFADGSYQMFERLRIRGGVHLDYTHRRFDDRSVDLDPYLSPGDGSPRRARAGGGSQKFTWSSLTWRAGIDFDVTPSDLVYALVSTGNRPGGFDFLSRDSYEEEEVLAVELGAKNSFFADRLRWNLAGFRYDYTDIQTRLPAPQSGRLAATNIPSAEIWGVEAEWLAEPLARLLLNGTFGWLKTRYDQDFTIPPFEPCGSGPPADVCPVPGDFSPNELDTINLKGKELSNSPNISLNIGVEYTYELAQLAVLPDALNGALTGRFDYTHRAAMFFAALPSDRSRQGAWDSGDVRLIYDKSFATCGFAIEGFVRNVWNETANTNLVASAGGRHEIAFANAPRTYGFRLTTRWQ